jgi:hypothetical protein
VSPASAGFMCGSTGANAWASLRAPPGGTTAIMKNPARTGAERGMSFS